MQYCYRQKAFLWIIGLAVPLFGPALPAARAQTESMADWQAKEKAGSYAEPAKSDRKVAFPGASDGASHGQL